MAKRGRPRKPYQMMSHEVHRKLYLIDLNAQDARVRLAGNTREWLRATLKNFRREAARAKDEWERGRVQAIFVDAAALAGLLQQFQAAGIIDQTQQDATDYLFIDDMMQRIKDEEEQQAEFYREVVEYQPEAEL